MEGNIHEVQLTSDVQQSGKTLVTCSHPKKDHRANSRKKSRNRNYKRIRPKKSESSITRQSLDPISQSDDL